jgi:hypothetical protein
MPEDMSSRIARELILIAATFVSRELPEPKLQKASEAGISETSDRTSPRDV